MPLKLNKSYFARNHRREKEFGDFFKKTTSGLSYIMAISITVFFTPAIITTSLFSKEIIVMLTNMSLSLGYITNFAYRIYQHEVSKAELLISLLTLATFLIFAYFLCPPFAALSVISVLGFLNQMALAVNLFFLMKHVVVPPCKKFIENIAQSMGFDIAGRYYSKPPLTLQQDRYILNMLLMKAYGHDSYSPEFNEKEIESFNNLLTKLSSYIDKYDESILGYINNKDDIAELEKQIALLTTKANPMSSYTFIRKKISFKTTKVKMLQAAEETVSRALNNPNDDASQALNFFSNLDIDELTINRQESLKEGLLCLDKEIQRQKSKIVSLEACLPQAILNT
jgi:hypothetical protein